MDGDKSRATYRILDASANRAFEGIRTLEDYARFALNNANLSESLKLLRHGLASAMKLLPREELLRWRDTPGDVGIQVQTASEYARNDASDVVAAAAARVQQSLRCLEEYGKVLSVDFAKEVEALRYRSYDVCATLELACIGDCQRMQQLDRSVLYVLSDAASSDEEFRGRLLQCVDGGVDVFQLRDRHCSDRELLERACAAMNILKDSSMLFIVNDRVDIAIAAYADGVHVGQDELPVDAVRRQAGPRMIVGVSTHNLDQARQAVRDGANYIGVGPCFPSQTKTFTKFVGTELLALVAQEIRIPAFAIGGITADHIDRVRKAGLHRVAVSAAVCSAADVRVAANEIKSRLLSAP